MDDAVEGLVRVMQSDYAQPLNVGSDEMVRQLTYPDADIEIVAHSNSSASPIIIYDMIIGAHHPHPPCRAAVGARDGWAGSMACRRPLCLSASAPGPRPPPPAIARWQEMQARFD